MWILIKDSRRNIRLEESSSYSQHVQTESEWPDGFAILDKTWDSGDDHNHMCDAADSNTNADCLEATEMFIGDPSTDDGTISSVSVRLFS